jgi:AraC family transcriptional regulator
MQVANKAVWVIERNFNDNLSLRGIAEACGVSSFHLAHAFGNATGRPVMSYVRGRRLTEAARKLAAGAPDILAVALESGYASHEAFTRAFRDQFGATPETVKRNASTDALPLVEPLQLPENRAAQLDDPEIVKSGPITVIGLSEHRMFDAPHKIPVQWQKFMDFYGLIDGKTNEIPVGVACDVDEDGGFEYLCAVETKASSDAPKGLKKLIIPAATYAVFAHTAHIATIGNTYLAIWNSWLTDHGKIAADAPSIEKHRPTFDTRTGEGGVDIWIPLKT